MNIAGLDLNLLKTFDAVMAERSVTRAAGRLGQSQPAVSNALNRLRDLFGDVLFVRTGHGLDPTPRAVELAAALAQPLAAIQQAVSDTMPFDPARSDRVFSLGMIEYVEASLADQLAIAVAKQAPNIRLRIVSLSKRSFADKLDRGEIDLAIGRFQDRSPRLEAATLYTEHLVGLMRADHPSAGTLSLETYLAAEHVLVSPSGDAFGAIDKDLAQMGRQRSVRLVLASYAPLPEILCRTDMIASVPSRVAERMVAGMGLMTGPLPITNQFDIVTVWHKRQSADRAHRWLRGQLRPLVNL